ncbi:hypothetical protein HPB49_004009 [Dermacentor silvarum]|uniref:Uncharacterized protein n=1 Tax=Dermacentor silvarum TaxID=543639 RepID=A0ACB8CV90_DERSI|nr:hypothetical protein HPB49_004009 [Dermacentor silvarum]
MWSAISGFLKNLKVTPTIRQKMSNCSFRTAMHLPCRYLLAMRCELGLAKFEPSLCTKRWLAEHYVRSRRVLLPDEHQMPEPMQIDKVEKQPILSSHQMNKKAAAIAEKIASIVSEVSMPKFQERLGILEALLRHWSLDEDILISKTQVIADGDIDDPCLKPEDIERRGKSSTAACTLSSAEYVYTSCETAVMSGKGTIPLLL